MRVGSEVADKPGRLLPEDCILTVLGNSGPYASRGGLKLEHALKTFHFSLSGKVGIDIGASTGGFTDCLLQHGIEKVYAVDVGYGQLDWKLRSDSRVVVLDRKNTRTLTLADLKKAANVPLDPDCTAPNAISNDQGRKEHGNLPPGVCPAPGTGDADVAVDLVVIDVSFISLKQVIPRALSLLKPEGDLIALVKPQFEVQKEEVEHKGIIRTPEKHLKVLLDLRDFVQAQGWVLCNLAPSPITGQKGNKEFLVHCVHKQRGEVVDEESIRGVV